MSNNEIINLNKFSVKGRYVYVAYRGTTIAIPAMLLRTKLNSMKDEVVEAELKFQKRKLNSAE